MTEYAEGYAKIKKGVISVDNLFTCQEIAALSRSSRQTTAEILNGFRKLALVDFGRDRFVIEDFARLRDVAG